MTRRSRWLLTVVAVAGVFSVATVSPANASITLVISEGSSTTTLTSAGSTLTFSGFSTTDYTGISGTVTMSNPSNGAGNLILTVGNATNSTGSSNPIRFDATALPYSAVNGAMYAARSTVSGEVLAGPSGTTGPATETLSSIFNGTSPLTLTEGPNSAPPAAGASSFPIQFRTGTFSTDGSYTLENILTFTTSAVGDSVLGQATQGTFAPEPAAVGLFLGGAGTLLLAQRARGRRLG